MSDGDNSLLFIIEYGVYPELIRALRQGVAEVKVEHQMRRSLSFLKRNRPRVVIAEFYHEPAFRDRVSNLESMLAHLQRNLPEVITIVLYNPEDERYLQQLLERFPVNHLLPTPVVPGELLALVERELNHTGEQ